MPQAWSRCLRPVSSLTIAVLLLGTTARCVFAQSDNTGRNSGDDTINVPRSSDPGKQPFVRQFFVDELHMWTSPFRASTYTGDNLYYVLPFTLVTGALIATDRHTAELLPNTPDQSKWSLRVSQIGAPYTLAGICVGTYFISKATHNKKAREASFLGAEAVVHTLLITEILKSATQRERPLDYFADGHGGTGFFRGGDSFPSGHSAGSFALATVMSLEYGANHKWVPFVSYGLATLVAASRFSGQKHWTSDIFVGGFMGGTIGRYVYKQHHVPGIGERPRRGIAKLTPAVALGPGQVQLAWNY